jgi:hypothetical protein
MAVSTVIVNASTGYTTSCGCTYKPIAVIIVSSNSTVTINQPGKKVFQ